MSRIESIRKLLETSPDDLFLLYSLAMELRSAGKTDEAVEAFQRILALDSAYLAAYPQLGQALADAGDRPAARATLRRGVEVAEAAGDAHTRDRLQLLLKSLGEPE